MTCWFSTPGGAFESCDRPTTSDCGTGQAEPNAATPRLFLRHPGLAQTSVKGRFGKGTDGRTLVRCVGPHASDVGITAFAAQNPGFGELRSGAFGIAFQGIGRGEPGVGE